MAKIDITFNAVLGGAVKATFESLQRGLKDVTVFLREVAKAEKEIGNKQASDALAHMAKGVGMLSHAFSTGDLTFKNMINNFAVLEKAQATWGNRTRLVQEAWNVFVASIENGQMSIKAAESRTKLYDNALMKLEGDLKLAGTAHKHYKDNAEGMRQQENDATNAARALNTELSLQQVNMLRLSGAIKLTGQGFKVLKDSAYDVLLSTERYDGELSKLIEKLKLVQGRVSAYTEEKRKAAAENRPDEFLKALNTLNLVSQRDTTGKAFLQQVKTLKMVEEAIGGVIRQRGVLTLSERASVTSLDRYNAVVQITNGNLKATTQGFKVLSNDGLKALGGISVETAGKLGILDKSFYALENKMKSFQQLRGFSDASFKQWQKGLLETGKSFSVLGDHVTNVITKSQRFGTLEKQIQALNIAGKGISSGPLKTALESLISDFEKFGKANIGNAQKVATQFDLVRSKVSELSKEFAKNESSVSNYEKAIEKLKSLAKSADDVKKLDEALRKNGQSFAENTKVVADYIKQAVNLNKVEEKANSLRVSYSELLGMGTSLSAESNQLITNWEREAKVIGYDKIAVAALTKELQKNEKAMNASLSAEEKKAKNIEILKTAYEKILKSQTDFGESARRIFTQYQSDGKSVEVVRLQLNLLNKAFEQGNREELRKAENLGYLSKRYSELLSTSSAFRKEALEIIVAYSRTGQNFKLVQESLTQLDREMKRTSQTEVNKVKNLDVLKASYDKLLQSETKYGESARRLFSDYARTGQGVEILKVHLRNLNGEMLQQERRAFTLSNILDSLARKFRYFSQFILVSNVFQSVAQSMRDASSAVIEHDQALHNLSSITQATVQEMNVMSTTLSEVAISTKFNLEEVAYGMQRLAQGGFNPQEIVQAIKPITDLATGTMESLGQSVDLVSTAIYSFGLKASDTAKVTDIFANGVTQSRLTVEGLNTAMNYVGPVAHMAGVSLEDTVVILEMFSNAGMRASTQGTALRRLFESLLTPSKEFKKAVQEAGMSLEDFNPTITPIEQIIDNLPKVVNDATDAFEMFGTRGANAVSVFAKQGSAEFLRLKAGVLQSGMAAKMAEEQQKGLRVSLDMVKAKAAELAVVLGKSLVPIFKGLLDSAQVLLKLLIRLADTGFGKVAVTATAAAAAFGMLFLAMKTWIALDLGAKIALIVYQLHNFTAILLTSGKVQAAFNLAVRIGTMDLLSMTTAVKGLTLALLSNPYAWAAALLGAIVIALNKYQSSLNVSIQKTYEYSTALMGVKLAIDSYNKIVEKSGSSSDEAKTSLESLKTAIKTTGDTTESTKGLMKGFSDSLEGLTPVSEEAEGAVAKVARTLQGELDSAYRKAAESARDLYNVFGAGIHAQAKVREGIEQIKKVLDSMSGSVGKAKNKMSEYINTALKFYLGISVGNDKIEEAIEKYEELSKAAENGTDDVKTIARAFEDQADRIIKKSLDQDKAAKMSAKELRDLAVQLAKTFKLNPAELGALISRMEKFAATAKKNAEALQKDAKAADTLKGAVQNLNNSIADMGEIPDDIVKSYVGDMMELQSQYNKWRIQEIDKHSKKVAENYQKEKKMAESYYAGIKETATSTYATQISQLTQQRDAALAKEQDSLNRKLAFIGEDAERSNAVIANSGKKQAAIVAKFEEEKNAIRKKFVSESHKNEEDRVSVLQHLEQQAVRAELDALNEKRKIFLHENEIRIADLEDHAQAHKALYEEMYAEEKAQLEQNLFAQNEALKGTEKSENQILIKKAQNQREYYQKLIELEKKSLSECEKIESEKLKTTSTITETLTEEGLRHFTNRTLAEKKAAEESMKIHAGVSEDGIRHFWNSVEEEKKATNESTKVMQEKFKNQETLIKASVALKEKDSDSEVSLARRAKSELHKLGKEQLKDQISTLKERQAKYKEVIEGLKALESSLTDAIIAEKKKIKDIDKSYADIAREIRQSTMTEEKKFAEDEIQLNHLIAEQKTAYLKGEGDLVDELQGKIVELAKTQLDRANADKEIGENGEKVVKTEAEKSENAEKYLGFIRKAMAVSQEMSKQTVEGLQKEKEETRSKIDEYSQGLEQIEKKLKMVMNDYIEYTDVALGALEELNKKIEEISSKSISKPITDFTANVKQAESAVDKLISKLRAAISLQSQASRTPTQHKATGGPIHGYGGGDIVPAMLEPGEWVISKEGVRTAISRFGSSFMHNLNKGQLKGFKYGGEILAHKSAPPVKFNTGGLVKESMLPSLPDFGVLKLNIGNKVFPVMANANVVSELSKYLKREALMGAN